MDESQQITSMKSAFAACRESLVAVGVFSFFINMLMLTPMFYMINVYDKAVATGSIPTLTSLILIASFLYIVLALLEWTRSKVLIHIGGRLDELVAPRLYRLSFDNASGKFSAARFPVPPLSDLNALRQFVGSANSAVIFDLPWIPIFMVMMYFFHPTLALVAIICIVIMTAVAIANQRSTTAGLQKSNEIASGLSSLSQRHFRNAEVAEAMGMVPSLTRRWRVTQDKMLAEQFKASATASGFNAAIKTLNVAMQSAAITVGAVLAIAQEISPGLIIGAALLLGRSLQPINQAVTGWKSFVDAFGQYNRLHELLQTVPLPAKPMKLPALKGRITCSDASIQPPGAQSPTLENVSFALEPGTVTMVLGASGAGKSTLVRSLLGLWPTTEGSIRFDGAEPGNYDLEELGPQIGYLPQDIELFDGSVADNIARFGEADAEAVIQAAQDAGIHDLILQLPDGYNTVISAQAGLLSPGQRQRVALARALYRRPQILVLDEPNSNLDEAGDRALNTAIATMKEIGSTVVMVSHRHAVLSIADYLLVVGKGTILHQGTRDEVIARFNSSQKAESVPAQNAAGTTLQSPKDNV